MRTKSATSFANRILVFSLAGLLAAFGAQTAYAETATGDIAGVQIDATSGDCTVQSGVLAGQKVFTERDLEQVADTSNAVELSLESGNDLTISEEGVYVVTGTANDATIIVDAADSAKVQIVLDGVSIVNGDAPAIYVKSADKVFVTLQGSNSISVTGSIAADGDTNVDAAIFSKDDLVLNGTGTLVIDSTGNAVTSKDDLRITGGTYEVACSGHAFEANDLLAVSDGSFTVVAGKDGFHSDNDEDGTLGLVYICGGTMDVTASSDGVHASAVAQIDGGTLKLNAGEGLEGTYVQVNDGSLDISASDDGINATSMSTAYETVLEITGGTMAVSMASGDTDALDTNGNLLISGGTVEITAQSAFDFDGIGELTGGTVTVNGEQVTELANSMMGGMGGAMGGQGQMMGGAMGGQGQMMGGGMR